MRSFILFLLASTSAFALEHSYESKDKTISEILANGKMAIQADEGDRIYLNPTKLLLTTGGIFLKLDFGDLIPISTLSSDENGCFIEASHSVKLTKKCPHCGEQRLSGIFKCPNPSCSSNSPYKEK